MKMIEIKNLGKKYKINKSRERYIALRDILTNLIKHPIKTIKEKRTKMEDFWALKDITFDVEKGDAIGIIGPNGAGKSTLLKIITQITPPTEGGVDLNGRVASLLEVGTGFHPELTGRENIYLNGAILGMTKKEIDSKIDEIIEFAEIDKFIETPVKRYSSGMYVRLAFSVAAHMEPDILLVDEVLAVGDDRFQRKCIGKMNEVTKKSDRTIFLVSHNMEFIKQLCSKCVLLNNGQIKAVGDPETVISLYKKNNFQSATNEISKKPKNGNGKINIKKISLRDSKGNVINSFKCGEDAEIYFEYRINDKKIDTKNIVITFSIDSLGKYTRTAQISNEFTKEDIFHINKESFIIKIKNLPLNVGKYLYSYSIDNKINGEQIESIHKIGTFDVEYGDFYASEKLPKQNESPILLNYNFK